MPVLSRNHRAIAAARPIADKRTRYRIEGVAGLWLDLTPKGKRTWYVRYQKEQRGKRNFRWYRIGDATAIGLSKASDHALKVIASVQVDGLDPHLERKTPSPRDITFGYLYDAWFERHALPRLARAKTDHNIYSCHLKNGLARIPASEIKRTEIGILRDELARSSGPAASNNVLELINRVFNWAVDEGLVEINPASRLRKVSGKRPRERVLSSEEIRAFWQALDVLEHRTTNHIARGEPGRLLTLETRSILRLMLLTGQRRGEITGAEKSELNFDDDEPMWTIPGARTKNGLLHRVPLCDMAVDEFRKALTHSPPESPFVFASPKDIKLPMLPSTVTRAMSRLTTEIGIKGASPHDLRRTVGTEMARLGLPTQVRALVLNHSPRANNITDSVYNRYAYDAEKREALRVWEEQLQEYVLKRQIKSVV